MKYISLHLLLSIALIGQAGALTNKTSLQQSPTIESPANDINNNNDNDDADYTVEAELMGAYGTQASGIEDAAMQPEEELTTGGMYGTIQDEQEVLGAYGVPQDFEDKLALDTNGAYGMPEVADEPTSVYANTQDTTVSDRVSETQKISAAPEALKEDILEC